MEIMCIRVRVEANFLHQRYMLMLLLQFFLFGKFVLVLAKVHNLADRGIGGGDDLDKIQTLIDRHLLCFLGSDHANLLPLFIDQPDLGGPDFRIDARALLLNGVLSYTVKDFC